MTGQQNSEKELKSSHDSELGRRAYSRNPIGVIALFVSFIEAVATVSLKFLLDASSPHTVYIVIFVIAFPSLIVILFFGTLWLRRESLYSPSDFREDETFVRLFAKVDDRFVRVELRQKAAQLDLRGDPNEVFELMQDLLANGDFETIISLGTGLVKIKRYSQASKFSDLYLSADCVALSLLR